MATTGSAKPAHAGNPADHPAPVEPENSSPSKLSALQGPQPHRADLRQTEATTPHRHPLGQDRPVVRDLPQSRGSTAMAEVFCLHGLATFSYPLASILQAPRRHSLSGSTMASRFSGAPFQTVPNDTDRAIRAGSRFRRRSGRCDQNEPNRSYRRCRPKSGGPELATPPLNGECGYDFLITKSRRTAD
jgi:hypothetical protein